jgi:hypothetical protein
MESNKWSGERRSVKYEVKYGKLLIGHSERMGRQLLRLDLIKFKKPTSRSSLMIDLPTQINKVTVLNQLWKKTPQCLTKSLPKNY